MTARHVFLTLFIALHEVKGDQTLSEAHLSYLLQNMTYCDLQILHDGLDIPILNIPVKVVWMPAYLDTELRNISYPAINVLMSRTAQYKFSFLLPELQARFSYNSLRTFKRTIATWIQISVSYHTYYAVKKIGKRYLLGENIFVILINMEINHVLKVKLDQFVLPYLHNRYVFIYLNVVEGGKNLEICGIPQSTGYVVSWSECREIIDWRERMSTIDSWQDKWCTAKQLGYKWLNDDLASASNPFDRNEIYTIKDLANIVFLRRNITIVYDNTIGCGLDDPQFHFNYKLGLSELTQTRDRIPDITIITKSTGYQYLTCYKEQYINFEMYIAPFEPNLWLTLLITLLLMITLTLVYHHYADKTSFSGWLFILATMFEETGHVPNAVSKLTPFRLTFGPWCLMSVVVTNCYNGLMISDLNAPLPTFKPKTYEDLLCDRVSQNTTDQLIAGMDPTYGSKEYKDTWDLLSWYLSGLVNGQVSESNYTYKREDCFSIYSVPTEKGLNEISRIERIPDFLHALFYRVIMHDVAVWESFFLKKQFNLALNLLLPKHSHYAVNFSYSDKPPNRTFQQDIEREVVKCGRSVFVAYSDVLEAEYTFLSKNYPWHKFHKGKEIFDIASYGVTFRLAGISKIPGDFKFIYEAGIYSRVEEELALRQNLKRKAVTQR
ncbi:Glutamate receptor ionotropic, delta-2 [Folsomia candida]|uniref:Glutamate receptor ionotropic, delta-2 n=1 Tax=Folsomia candida TaxID=158441 RepID=A0A226CUL6_FOLCA|nr:Glutamate receptor ionotropic, delta-2 [Folsomia candida]